MSRRVMIDVHVTFRPCVRVHVCMHVRMQYAPPRLQLKFLREAQVSEIFANPCILLALCHIFIPKTFYFFSF